MTTTILAADFRCTNPDGSLVDRDGFLKQTAVAVLISNLEAYDVEVRVLDDFAIIHARTRYTLADGRAGRRTVHRRVGTSWRRVARRLRARHARAVRRVIWAPCLRIECFYPEDRSTEATTRRLADEQSASGGSTTPD